MAVITDDDIAKLDAQQGQLPQKKVLTDDDIAAMDAQQQPKPQGFLGQAVAPWVKAAKNVYQGAQQGVEEAKQQKSLPEYLLHLAGTAGGTLMDVPVEAVKAAYESSGPLKKPIGEAAAGVAGAAKGNQTLSDLILGAQQWAKDNPRLAGDIGAAANVASVLPVGKGLEMAGKGVAETVAPAVEKVAAGVNELKGNVGNTLQDVATKIQNRKIRIGKSEQEAGATRQKLGQYDLFGSTKDVVEKTQSQIKDLAKQLHDKINSVEFDPNDPDTRINISQLLNRAKNRAVENTRTDKIAVNNSADNVINELTQTYGLDFDHTPAVANNIDLAEAQLLKQEIGKKGDWLAKNGKISANEDATNKSQFYNTVYDELKKELENKGPEGIKQINKQLSDLIPIDRAASKRLLVEDRNNIIGIEDYLGGLATAASLAHGNPLPAMVTAMNMASKSPLTAKALYNLGSRLKGELPEKAVTQPTLNAVQPFAKGQ